MSLDLTADRRLIRTGSASTRYVRARIEAPAAPRDSERLPVNIAFVLDRSGSMHGEKIRLAREAVLTAIRSLRDEDRFSVVVYDDQVDLVAPGTPATASARRKAESVLRQVEARGMTDLAGGWLAGCAQVAEALDEAAVGHCLLLSDGLANRGLTDHGELVAHARELAARSVATTAFGIGRDFDERLLGDMADAGAGNFYYVESPAQILDFIASEVGEALEVVAAEARLVIDVPASVRVSVLNDLNTVREGARLTVELGSLVSEQVFDVVLKLKFPCGPLGAEQVVAATLRDRDEVLAGDAATLAFTYASAEENDAQVRARPVDREVAALYAARAHGKALDYHDRAAYEDAVGTLNATARRIAEYAADDSELLAIIRNLRDANDAYSGMMALKLKKLYFATSHNRLHGRDLGAKAMRRFDVFDDE